MDQVRRVLLDEWDPLSVGPNPNLADEYDDVLGKVMACLAPNPPADVIADLLEELERDYLCLPQPRREPCRAAASLASLRRATEPWPTA